MGSLDQISAFTGISKSELQSIAAEVKANWGRIRACKRHNFKGGAVTLGQKHVCLACGGEVDNTYIGAYIDGYEAGGGAADDVWPRYRSVRPAGA